MKADIVTIGDEILIGQITDTNAAFLGDELTKLGFEVRRIISIPDQEQDIIDTLDECIKVSDLVLLTGGLGPTNDDITKNTLRKYFKAKYVIHKPTLEHLKSIFASRQWALTDRNRKQAEVPDTCTPILNSHGTAPGMLFRQNNTLVISLPGVPFEMKGIFTDELQSLLASEFELPVKLHTTVLTSGLSESGTADKILDWENALPNEIGLAYLPTPGILRLRISVSGDNKGYLNDLLNTKVRELEDQLGTEHVFGRDEDTLQAVVGELLTKGKYSVATAESCTGGTISHLITSVAGASAYFKGSVTAYANEIKHEILGVNTEIIQSKGAVSKEVVEEMALGVQKLMKTDFAIATSGIAGPTGGSEEKPVGTTWIAVAGPKKVISAKYLLGNKRDRCIAIASHLALNMLRNAILELEENNSINA